ncbi:MAG: hypothetical protein IPM82_07840 [Saprospiraceae bacterium]|nr:hypothetical protein [Saprospiraceae bacterium]
MSKRRNLILGGQYLLDSLTITPILIDPTKSGARPHEPILYNAEIWADNNTTGYIIQLDTLPPDTLLATTFELVAGKDDCCPGFTSFETLTLNGQAIPSDYTVCCIKIFK